MFNYLLFIMTKHNVLILEVSPFFKLKNST